MRNIFTYLLTLTMLLVTARGYTQTYPVTVNTQLIPPYSVYLSDYASPESERLFVSLLFNDPTVANYNVKLRLTIEGVGIGIESKPDAYYPPITVSSGMMQRLTGNDLAPYFNPNNLIFQGLSKEQYMKNAALPEGMYKFCVQVYDYNKNIALSRKECTTAWLILNDPPRIVSPACKSMVQVIYPQNVVFQWMPMHLSSPNAASGTEYHFRLVQILPVGRNPNDAMLSSPPIFEAMTENTSLYFGISEPQLIPGQQYAWRVQAKDKSGKDLFKNSGYSEVCMFTYGEPCKPPVNIKGLAESPQRGRVTWDQMYGPSGFAIRYRERGVNSEWYQSETFQNSVSLSGLKPDRIYEYQVQSLCEPTQSEYSPVDTFSTKSNSSFKDCGVPVTKKTVDRTTSLIALYPNDALYVDGFKVRVTEATGSNGTFSGKGVAYIPYMNIYIFTVFNGIKVNARYEVYEGKIVSVRANIEKYRPQIPSPPLKNDICQEVPENKESTNKGSTTASGNNKGKDGAGNEQDSIRVIVINGDIEVKEGDKIILNGKEVTVTKDTEIKPGDVVVVNGKTVNVEKVETKMVPNPSSVDPVLAGKVKDMIVKLRDAKYDTISTLKASFLADIKRYKTTSLISLNELGNGQSTPLITDTSTGKAFKPISFKVPQNSVYIDNSAIELYNKERIIISLLKYIAMANHLLESDGLNDFISEVGKEANTTNLNSGDEELEKVVNNLISKYASEYSK